MKRLIAASLVCLMMASPVFAITEIQAKIGGVLEVLKLKLVDNKGVIGGPQKYESDKNSLVQIKDGHVLVVEGDGSISIEKKK